MFDRNYCYCKSEFPVYKIPRRFQMRLNTKVLIPITLLANSVHKQAFMSFHSISRVDDNSSCLSVLISYDTFANAISLDTNHRLLSCSLATAYSTDIPLSLSLMPEDLMLLGSCLLNWYSFLVVFNPRATHAPSHLLNQLIFLSRCL
jgi:hypothetical protein